MRVMIVDDEKPCLEDLSFLLLHCDGIDISGAFTQPEEALAAVKALRPDVLFLDLKMPKLSGAELARKALALLPDLRLVFVTAYTKELENVRGLPVFGSLLKPVGNTKLNELMDRLRADQI